MFCKPRNYEGRDCIYTVDEIINTDLHWREVGKESTRGIEYTSSVPLFHFHRRFFVARCAILIDGAYLDKVLENDFNRVRIDIGRLGDELAGAMERMRTYYYHCMPYMGSPPTEEERRRFASKDAFMFNLKQLPRLQVRQGKLQKIAGQFKQKRVDISMAVDLVRMSSSRQIEKAVLITGDSDLVPAIESARDSGVVVELYYSPNSRHDELLQACDERFEITRNLLDRIKLPPIKAVPTHS
jgi:uncharacterized LabA/DUF88 family protein